MLVFLATLVRKGAVADSLDMEVPATPGVGEP